MDDIAVLGFATEVAQVGKEFTVFNIFVTVNGRIHHIKKRYSDLLHLHKELRKYGHVPTFPPKNVRNQNRQVIEARCQALHRYYQTIIRTTSLKDILFDLLGVPRIHNPNQEDNCGKLNASLSTLSYDEEPQHGRILYFSQDLRMFCREKITSRPNSVITGVMKGFYDDQKLF